MSRKKPNRLIKVKVQNLAYDRNFERKLQRVAGEVEAKYDSQRYDKLHLHFRTINESAKKDREDLLWMFDYAKSNNMATPVVDLVCIKKSAF